LGYTSVVSRACFLVLLAALACGDKPPAGVEDLRLDAPSDHHARNGFVQMIAPVRLPSSSPDVDQVEVWLRIPDGAEIEATPGPSGELLLDFPVGTIADRVEFVGLGAQRRVADIRGAEIVDGRQQRFHVYRPTSAIPGDPLYGVQWSWHDDAAHRAATDRLLAKLDDAYAFEDDTRREAFLRDVRAKNACLPCHAPARPENATPREHGLVNRGTDHSGFFTPATVLRDAIPLESYGAHDGTLGDAAVKVVCAGGELEGRECSNGVVPIGHWTGAAAPADRVRMVCEARRYLVEHMSPEARARFESSLAPCNG
jgi:hypothetical protein